MAPDTLNPAYNRQKNICEYCGVFGALLTLTCLIQHIAVVIPSYYTNPMIPGYLLAIAAFILLALQKINSLVFLIISAVYVAVIEGIWIMHSSFSLVVMLLFIYNVIIIVVVYTEQIPQQLKQKRLAQMKEEELWRGKI